MKEIEKEFFTDNFIMSPDKIIGRKGRSHVIKKMVSAFNHNDIKNHLFEPKRNVSDFDKPYKYPDNLVAYKIKSNKCSIEILTDKTSNHENNKDAENNRADENKIYDISDRNIVGDKKENWVVLQIHGGGYINAFKNHYRTMAKMYVQHASPIDVLSVDYRVAPKNLYPAALEDVVCAYEWLLANGYLEEHIIVAGDSAGGGLTLALCHYLKDRDRKLPAGLICMSPWTDLTLSGESYNTKFEVDAVFGNLENSIIYNNPYPGEEDLKNPYISPLFGDFTGFPPMLIQVGSDEMLLDDSVCVAKKARELGVKVRLSEYEGMFHVFQLCGAVLEESKYAWEEIGEFIKFIKNEN